MKYISRSEAWEHASKRGGRFESMKEQLLNDFLQLNKIQQSYKWTNFFPMNMWLLQGPHVYALIENILSVYEIQLYINTFLQTNVIILVW